MTHVFSYLARIFGLKGDGFDLSALLLLEH